MTENEDIKFTNKLISINDELKELTHLTEEALGMDIVILATVVLAIIGIWFVTIFKFAKIETQLEDMDNKLCEYNARLIVLRDILHSTHSELYHIRISINELKETTFNDEIEHVVEDIDTISNVLSEEINRLSNDILEESQLDESEVELLAGLAVAEAGNQGDLGMRYVIDVVLNRVDDGLFPNDIKSVIFQPGQFTNPFPIDGDWRVMNATTLVEEEIKNRTNYDILWFNTGDYLPYGMPMFQYKDHYFSGNE